MARINRSRVNMSSGIWAAIASIGRATGSSGIWRAVGGASLVVAWLASAGMPYASSARAVGTFSVPPGFDHGNQTSISVMSLKQNINLSALGGAPCFKAPAVGATDNVPGPHGANDPIALTAFGGLSQIQSVSKGSCVDTGAPPDSTIAAGGGFVVEEVNQQLAIFDRSGKLLKTVRESALFESGPSDPKIVFDPLPTPHWYATSMVGGGPDSGDAVDIAISRTGDPTGLWDLYRVAKEAKGQLADQPKLGFSLNKVVITWTQFSCDICFHDDHMIVIQKSDLTSFAASARAIDINMSTELNKRFSIIPAIPLPSAEVNNTFAVSRGSDVLGHYESSMAVVGLPSTGDVAFKETGNKIQGTGDPPAAEQPGVSPNQIDSGDDRMLSVSLISASAAPNNFSGILWTAGDTKCKPSGSSTDRACVRINKVAVNSSGDVTTTVDSNIGQAGSDILYPAVVGDTSGNHVWVTDTRTGASTFPTAELRLVTLGVSQRTITFGNGTASYTTDRDPQHGNNSRFGDYSGIYVDPTDRSGATVWAAAEIASVPGIGWATSIVQATLRGPTVTAVTPNQGYAGDAVDVFGSGFSASTLVRFGAVPVQPDRVTFLGSDHLRVKVPAQPPTTVNVFTTTLRGTNTPLPGPPLPAPGVADRFTYHSLLWSSGVDPKGDVAAINPSTDKRVYTSPTFAVSYTKGIAESPDGTSLLATSPAQGVVFWIDAATGAVRARLQFGVKPSEVTFSADGKWAFVTDPGAFGGSGGVIPIQMPTGTGYPKAQAAIPIPDPRGVATAANGSVFVTSGISHGVLILRQKKCPTVVKWCIDTGLNVPTGTPGPISSGPDRVWLGVAGLPGLPPGLIYSIDPTSPALSSPLNIDGAPIAMAVSPDGHSVFAITHTLGNVYSLLHHPPAADSLGPVVSLPDGPLGGGVVSFDSSLLYVAGGASGHINVAVVPAPYKSALLSGLTTSNELTTNLPPRYDCGGKIWNRALTSITFATPGKAPEVVGVTGSALFCPRTGGVARAVPVFVVRPPKGKGCPKAFVVTLPKATLRAPVVSFSGQFKASCSGTWKVTPGLSKYVGPGKAPAFPTAPIGVAK